MNHGLPEGPHGDLKDGFDNWWRVFLDGRIELK